MKYEKKHNLFHISAQYAEGSEAPLNHKLLGPTSTNDSALPLKFLYFVSLPPPSVCFCCLYVFQKSIKPIRRRDILSYFIDYLTSLSPVFYLVDSQDIHKKNTFNPFVFFLCSSIFGGTTVLQILSSWSFKVKKGVRTPHPFKINPPFLQPLSILILYPIKNQTVEQPCGLERQWVFKTGR